MRQCLLGRNLLLKIQNPQKTYANFRQRIQDPDGTVQIDGRNCRCLRCLETKNYP